MISLQCPSCGGKLDVPGNLDIAHCIYCGTKIIITEAELSKDKLRLKSYLDICESAIKAKNYQEVLDYSNKILEIDSKNIDAWINKAIATFWLKTVGTNRNNEADSYLDKAEQLNPGNPRIREIKEELSTSHVLYRLGLDSIQHAYKIFKTCNSNNTPDSIKNAQIKSKHFWGDAGKYFLQALKYEPYNMDILSSISSLVKETNWMPWNDEILNRAQYHDQLERDKKEIENLPKYKEALKQAEIELSNAERENIKYFEGGKVKKAKLNVKQLNDYIASLEKLISTKDSITG